MTRKDFELIAGVLKDISNSNKVVGDTAENLMYQVRIAMSDALATTNPRFDRTRFLTASK